MDLRPQPRSRGDLGQTPAARLLWDLAAQRFTGTLLVRCPPEAGPMHGESAFAFEDGHLAQARVPHTLDALGVVLKEANLITQEQLDDSIARVRADEGLQGAVLVAQGACGLSTVEWGLRAQLCRKVMHLFALREAPFELHPDLDLLADFGGRRCLVEVASILWDGVRAHPDHPAVDAVLGRVGSRRFRLVADSVAPTLLGDGAADRALLERVRRPARLSDFADCDVPVAVARAFVAMLVLTRQLEPAPTPTAQTPGLREPGARTSSPSSPAVVPVTSFSSPAIVPVAPPPRTASSPAVAPVAPAARSSSPAVLPVSAPPRSPSSAAVVPVSAPPRSPSSSAVVPVGPPRSPSSSAVVPVAPSPEAIQAARQAARQSELGRGEHHLRQGRFLDAEQSARLVLADDANDTDALLLLATAILEGHGAERIAEVRKVVTSVLAAAPENDRAYVVAAGMFKRLGDEKRSLSCFAKACKLNPRNVDAARQLRLATMRRRNEREEGDGDGFLAKLLGNRG